MRYLAAAMLAGAACIATPLAAQSKGKAAKAEESWSVEAPKGAVLKQVPIKVDEGTWMDVDVAPDGQTLAFTLLGDIYIMPMSGGTPKRIAEGLAWEVQPRFSPDGTRIAFTSDRGGSPQIYRMSVGSGTVERVTFEGSYNQQHGQMHPGLAAVADHLPVLWRRQLRLAGCNARAAHLNYAVNQGQVAQEEAVGGDVAAR
jgi:hypothetical protein